MGLFDWIRKRSLSSLTITQTDKYKVGLVEIDAQHQKLFSLYNNLVEAMYRGESMKVLQDVLNQLIEYVVVHFTTEENYYRRYNHPEYERHKSAHNFYRNKTLQIHREFSEGKPVLTAEVIDFLRQWLTEHIMNMDKKHLKDLVKMGAK